MKPRLGENFGPLCVTQISVSPRLLGCPLLAHHLFFQLRSANMTDLAPSMDQVVLPTDESFEEFRSLCMDEEGWTDVLKDDKYRVWTRKV